MNYSHAQKISIFVSEGGDCVTKSDDPKYELNVLISSMGSLFTIVYLQRLYDAELREDYWHVSHSPPNYMLKKFGSCVVATLQKQGLAFLEGEVLNEIVVGVTTEMDESPATVFEALFSELY